MIDWRYLRMYDCRQRSSTSNSSAIISMFFLLLVVVVFFLAVCISTIQMHSLTWQTYKGQNKVCMHVSSDRKYAMISAPTLNSCHYSTWLKHFWRNNKNSAIFPHFHFFFSFCCFSFIRFSYLFSIIIVWFSLNINVFFFLEMKMKMWNSKLVGEEWKIKRHRILI